MSTSEFHTRWCEIHWYPMIMSKIRRLASKHVTGTHHLHLGNLICTSLHWQGPTENSIDINPFLDITSLLWTSCCHINYLHQFVCQHDSNSRHPQSELHNKCHITTKPSWQF